ncbi:carboxypeptidase regulatory-like domain-containing protein [Ligaoa zhengdingensis]|uniref:carboxypeptidase regulatory-like domain-containing protein n=4 Tax=Ligaoa zhengdingensis TaxID=2763658 RepID=UPI0031BA39E8
MKTKKKLLALVLALAMLFSCLSVTALAATRDVNRQFAVTGPDGTKTTGIIFFSKGEEITIGYTWGVDPLNKTKECWVLTINGVPISQRSGRYTFMKVGGVNLTNASGATLSDATVLYEGSYTAGTAPSVIYDDEQEYLPSANISMNQYSSTSTFSRTISFSKNPNAPSETSYSLSYSSGVTDNSVSGVPAAGTYKAGATVTIPAAAPTRSGYNFYGWLDAVSGSVYSAGQSFSMPDRAVVLQAQWQTPTIPDANRNTNKTITVTDHDGEEWRGTFFFESTESFTIGYTWGVDPLNKTKECWVLTVNGVPVSQNYGQYAFYKIGGVNLPDAEYANINKATILYEGSRTAGVGPAVIYAPKSCVPSGTLTYENNTSNFWQGIQFTRQQYSVTFAAGAEDASIEGLPAGVSYIKGANVPMPEAEPTRRGYTFAGWENSADGLTYQAGDSFVMPNQVVTMTAQWRAKTLRGTVTAGGNPVANRAVSLRNLDTNTSYSVKTDAEGYFEFDGDAGKYRIYVAGNADYKAYSATFSVVSGTVHDIALELVAPVVDPDPDPVDPDPTGTLSGTVTADGSPVANRTVSLRNLDTNTPYSAKTDANGVYAADLPEGKYRIYVAGDTNYKAYSATFDVAAGTVHDIAMTAK